jgi:hypothetical protein
MLKQIIESDRILSLFQQDDMVNQTLALFIRLFDGIFWQRALSALNTLGRSVLSKAALSTSAAL